MTTVLQSRGDAIEARHPFSAAWSSPAGTRLLGDDVVSTFRSAAKPFQLACSLESLGRAAFTDAELAIGAASHSAQPRHLALVHGLLRRFSLPASALRCGAHAPVHEPSAHAVIRAGNPFVDVHNNCSGKHTYMLAACAAEGWDRDYRPIAHPLQQRILAHMTDLLGRAPGLAVDGCGVPTFCAEISAFSRGWQAVAEAMADLPGDDVTSLGLGRIGWAMARRPDLTAGDGRLDVAVVHWAETHGVPIAVKIGAAGLFCIAIPDLRAGICVKVHSGDTDALSIAVIAALRHFLPWSWDLPDPWQWATVRNVIGVSVGRRWAALEGGDEQT